MSSGTHELTTLRETPLLEDVRRVGRLAQEALGLGLAVPAATTLRHFYGTGTYARVLDIPAGTVLEGKTHRHSTILVVLAGGLDIIASHGERRSLAHGDIVTHPPFTRRAMATREGATVVTIHHTAGIDTTAPDAQVKLQELLIAEEDNDVR